MNITIIIPTLDPSERILKVLSQLCEKGFREIIVVNDGSNNSKQPIFDQIALIPQCRLLVHPENYGKGRALKTAMKYYLEHNVNSKGVVTCDDDGQHCIEDILKCANSVLAHDRSLVLGVRSFDSSQVPMKSQIGNKLTKWYMDKLCKIEVSDTQTGLRGIPNKVIPIMLQAPGNRFEYETNMLLETRKQGIHIHEVPINTVYIEDNRATRFHPIRDSIQIYFQLAKFSLSSGISFLVDIGLFMIASKIFEKYETVVVVFLATLISRFCSSIVNYLANKKLVFCHEGSVQKTAIKYYSLCVIQGFASFALVTLMTAAFSNTYVFILKILVDCCLFVLSFHIQKRWVFRK